MLESGPKLHGCLSNRLLSFRSVGTLFLKGFSFGKRKFLP